MSQPPRNGPITVAMPDHAVQEPIAPPRSSGGNALTITARALGASSAPKTPCRTRAATSTSMLGASAHSSEATPKPPTPIENTRRSPKHVAERPADEDERAERQQVAVGDPLLAGQPAAEIALDRRQRDVDDRRVEARDEGAHDRRQQHQPLRRDAILEAHPSTLQSGWGSFVRAL